MLEGGGFNCKYPLVPVEAFNCFMEEQKETLTPASLPFLKECISSAPSKASTSDGVRTMPCLGSLAMTADIFHRPR